MPKAEIRVADINKPLKGTKIVQNIISHIRKRATRRNVLTSSIIIWEDQEKSHGWLFRSVLLIVERGALIAVLPGELYRFDKGKLESLQQEMFIVWPVKKIKSSERLSDLFVRIERDSPQAVEEGEKRDRAKISSYQVSNFFNEKLRECIIGKAHDCLAVGTDGCRVGFFSENLTLNETAEALRNLKVSKHTSVPIIGGKITDLLLHSLAGSLEA